MQIDRVNGAERENGALGTRWLLPVALLFVLAPICSQSICPKSSSNNCRPSDAMKVITDNLDVDGWNSTATRERKGKGLLSLGKVLNFFPVGGEKECKADGPLKRSGICLNPYECHQRGGKARGDCAHGFGVCCAFTATCGGKVANNLTYIQSPDFPEFWDGGEDCNITITKMHEGISQLRLDFIHFNIGQPNRSTGACDGDVFELSGDNNNLTNFKLCGQNHGQHIYYDIDGGPESVWNLRIRTRRNGVASIIKQVQKDNTTGNDVKKNGVEKKNAPVKKNVPLKKNAPVKNNAPAKKNAPVEKNSPVRKNAPIKKNAPMKKNAPAQKKNKPNFKKKDGALGFYWWGEPVTNKNKKPKPKSAKKNPNNKNNKNGKLNRRSGRQVNAAIHRLFQIRVTQLPLAQRAPPGCLQYFKSWTGTFQTMNFAENGRHLSDQEYKVCVQRAPSACAISYEPCDASSFRIGPRGDRQRPADVQFYGPGAAGGAGTGFYGPQGSFAMSPMGSFVPVQQTVSAPVMDDTFFPEESEINEEIAGSGDGPLPVVTTNAMSRQFNRWSPWAQQYARLPLMNISNQRFPYWGYGNYGSGLTGYGRQRCDDRITAPCDNDEFITGGVYGAGVCDPHHCGSTFCPGSPPGGSCRIESSVTPFQVSIHFGPPTPKSNPEENIGACLRYEQVKCS